jgi:hypothetical protein
VATELLFEAYKNYIEPLLDFGWIRINEQGFLAEREHGNILHYINDNYSGKPGEVPCTYPVVPLSDAHFLQIKENPEWELFNPFSSIKHMTLVALEFKRGLVILLSNESSILDLEQQEELIRFFYEEHGTDSYLVGYCNVENEAEPKTLYTYIGNGFIEAMWGLCVTAFNDVDRKHSQEFYDIEKTWRKIIRLVNKWDNERMKLLSQVKNEQQQNYGFQSMDLSDTANTKITQIPPDYFIAPEEQDAYLLSLFGAHELLPALSNDGQAELISVKERVWQLPDFATDEALLKKEKAKAKKSSRKKTSVKTDELVLPPAIMPPIDNNLANDKNVEIEIEEEDIVCEALKDERPEQNSVPKEESAKTDIRQKQPPLHPISPYPPQAVPVYPMSGFGFQPQYPFYNGFGYNQYQNMYFNQFMPPPIPQNVPTDINEIDFVSIEHPDPFANYRKK